MPVLLKVYYLIILENTKITPPPVEISDNFDKTQEYFLSRWKNYDEFYTKKEKTFKSLKERKKIGITPVLEPIIQHEPVPVVTVESQSIVVESRNNVSVKHSDQKTSAKRRKGF